MDKTFPMNTSWNVIFEEKPNNSNNFATNYNIKTVDTYMTEILFRATRRIKEKYCSNCKYADYNLSCCYMEEPICPYRSMIISIMKGVENNNEDA